MDLRPILSQQQSLKLSMTPELSQAIALLQFSALELIDFLEDKELENPLLQVKNINIKQFQPPKKANISHSNEKSWVEQIGDERYSLADHLLTQLLDMKISPLQSKVITYYIYLLDDNGYFTEDLTVIADKFNFSLSEAEECLARLQMLEPAGIGARNLKECLLLQIKRQENRNELAEIIVSEYFTMFAEKKWKQLKTILSVDIKDIQQVFDYILTLNPRPGSSFQYERAHYINPDVIVVKNGKQFIVQLYDDFLPNIQFNKNYYENLSPYPDKHVKQYLSEKLQDYHWVVRSIEQRQKTILNVTGKILEKQPVYFERGPDFLRPMSMKEISEDLGIHESTVSRTVRGKYMQTPFGTVELKSFFTNPIAKENSESISANEVKGIMEKLIGEENKQKPLSDSELVELLNKQEGIVVSRRTLAKYRLQLGIPSASKRKRYD